MKAFKNILCFLILTILSNNLRAGPVLLSDSTQSLPEFRKMKWNYSLKEIEEHETAHYLQNFSGFGIEVISFKGEFAGLDARIDYTFRNNKFSEGSYTINSEELFINNFIVLLNLLESKFGKPMYRSGPLYTSDSIWVKINDLGMFNGPAIYWTFKNGFIALITQKVDEKVIYTILYAVDVTIREYSTKNLVNFKDFKVFEVK